jgi:hypothetical protein
MVEIEREREREREKGELIKLIRNAMECPSSSHPLRCDGWMAEPFLSLFLSSLPFLSIWPHLKIQKNTSLIYTYDFVYTPVTTMQHLNGHNHTPNHSWTGTPPFVFTFRLLVFRFLCPHADPHFAGGGSERARCPRTSRR